MAGQELFIFCEYSSPDQCLTQPFM